MYAKIKSWFDRIPRKVRHRISLAVGIPGTIVSIVTLISMIWSWWSKPETTQVATTSPVVQMPMEKLSKEDREEFSRARFQTTFDWINPTHIQLNRVMFKAPKKGIIGVVSEDKVEYFGRFSGRYDLAQVRPVSAVSIVLFHEDQWKPGEKIWVSSEETELQFH